MTRHRWVELDEFPDYTVSEYGEIANMKTGMVRKVSINQHGIVKISIYRGRELHTRSVAVLVAEAFVDGKTEFFNTPIHLDGDKSNCRADNLMWRPRWFAVQYHKQFFNPAFHEALVPVVELNSGEEFESVKDACMALGLYHDHVYRSFVHGEEIALTGHAFDTLESDEVVPNSMNYASYDR